MPVQLYKLKILLGISNTDTTQDQKLLLHLETAKWAILNRRYPLGAPNDDLEVRYESLQIRAAAELFAKEGAEGETEHVEGDISRYYDGGSGISASLLSEVVPKVGVL